MVAILELWDNILMCKWIILSPAASFDAVILQIRGNTHAQLQRALRKKLPRGPPVFWYSLKAYILYNCSLKFEKKSHRWKIWP